MSTELGVRDAPVSVETGESIIQQNTEILHLQCKNIFIIALRVSVCKP